MLSAWRTKRDTLSSRLRHFCLFRPNNSVHRIEFTVLHSCAALTLRHSRLCQHLRNRIIHQLYEHRLIELQHVTHCAPVERAHPILSLPNSRATTPNLPPRILASTSGTGCSSAHLVKPLSSCFPVYQRVSHGDCQLRTCQHNLLCFHPSLRELFGNRHFPLRGSTRSMPSQRTYPQCGSFGSENAIPPSLLG